MNENEIASIVINISMQIHKRFGPGLLESAYESILFFELTDQGVKTSRQVPVPLTWNNHIVEDAFRADLIVENKVIVEIKSVERLTKVHEKQLLLGLLLNFGQQLLKDGIERIINGTIEAEPDNLFR